MLHRISSYIVNYDYVYIISACVVSLYACVCHRDWKDCISCSTCESSRTLKWWGLWLSVYNVSHCIVMNNTLINLNKITHGKKATFDVYEFLDLNGIHYNHVYDTISVE